MPSFGSVISGVGSEATNISQGVREAEAEKHKRFQEAMETAYLKLAQQHGASQVGAEQALAEWRRHQAAGAAKGQPVVVDGRPVTANGKVLMRRQDGTLYSEDMPSGFSIGPKPVTNPEQQYIQEELAKGVTLEDAIKKYRSLNAPSPKPTFEEQSYQEWHATHPKGTRMQFETERAAATQKPERPERPQRPPRAMAILPGGKVIEVTPGAQLPLGAKTLSQYGAPVKPTADEQRRGDLAVNMDENLTAFEDIVTRRPELFGWVAGWKTLTAMTVGTSDPDIAALKNIKEQMGLAMVGAHAMRNAQHVETAASSIVNGFRNSPSAMLGPRGSIALARKSLKTFIEDTKRAQKQRTDQEQQQQPIIITDPAAVPD